MKMKKLYDIRITKGDDKGCYRMANIENKEVAEMIKAKFFDESDEIIEREVPMSDNEQEIAYLFGLN